MWDVISFGKWDTWWAMGSTHRKPNPFSWLQKCRTPECSCFRSMPLPRNCQSKAMDWSYDCTFSWMPDATCVPWPQLVCSWSTRLCLVYRIFWKLLPTALRRDDWWSYPHCRKRKTTIFGHQRHPNGNPSILRGTVRSSQKCCSRWIIWPEIEYSISTDSRRCHECEGTYRNFANISGANRLHHLGFKAIHE